MSNGIKVALYNPYDISLARPVLNVLIPFCDAIADSIDTIVVPATKPVPIAWYLADRFGWNLVVLKKDKKPYHKNPIFFEAKSITSDRSNKLFITANEKSLLEGKSVLFFDDVLSSGATYRASKRFLKQSCKIANLQSLFVFKEGHAYKCGKEVHFFGQLPLEVNDDKDFRKRSQEETPRNA